VVFGNWHSQLDMSGFIEYGQNAETDVDVGISADGTNWKVSASTSSRVGNSGFAHFDRGAEDGHQFRINVVFEKLKTVRDCGFVKWTHYKVRAVKWTGGSSIGNDTHNLDHQCLSNTTYRQYRTVLARGYTLQVRNFRSIRYGGSISVFGLTLGSTTKNAKYVTEQYKTGMKNMTHSLCGTDDFVLQASTRLAGD
jgi:hypothetical protein